MDEDKSKFLVTLAYGRLSALEIASILDRDSLDFEILRVSDRAVLVECDSKTAKSLIRETGGSYKIARIFGETIEELYEEITLPDEAKFNWTVSGYDCDSELLENTKLSVQSFLKSRSLGKSRFIPPNAESEDDDRKTPGNLKELKIKDVFERILFPEGKIPEGLDIVVAGGFAKGPLFGCTLAASDVLGFQKRDFSRSYQNPTMTLGPRLGRILVNLGMKYGGGTLLDPFCGLGTILQEALMTGRNVVGVDISQSNVDKTRTNLDWIQRNYQATRKLSVTLIRANAMNLSKEKIPPVEGIAAEPILLPKYEKNPTATCAKEDLSEVSNLYERSLKALRGLLKEESRIAVVAPVVIDDRGREHKLKLSQPLKEMDFRFFNPNVSGLRNEYPFRVPTLKRKIVQREVYVMAVG